MGLLAGCIVTTRQANIFSCTKKITGEVDAKGLPDLFFDYPFTDFFKSTYGERNNTEPDLKNLPLTVSLLSLCEETISNSIVTGGAARPRNLDLRSEFVVNIALLFPPKFSPSLFSTGPQHESDLQALSDQKLQIAKQQAELDTLRKRVSELEAALASERQAFDAERATFNRTIDDLTEKLATKEKEEEELLLLLADQDLKLKELGINDDPDEGEDADGGIQ